jgi:hypothetical protein
VELQDPECAVWDLRVQARGGYVPGVSAKETVTTFIVTSAGWNGDVKQQYSEGDYAVNWGDAWLNRDE